MEKRWFTISFTLLIVLFASDFAQIRAANSVRVSAASTAARLFSADCEQLEPLLDPALDSGLEWSSSNSAESHTATQSPPLPLVKLEGSPSRSRLGPELTGRHQRNPSPLATEGRSVQNGDATNVDGPHSKMKQPQGSISITALRRKPTGGQDPNPPLRTVSSTLTESRIDVTQCEEEVARDREGSSFGSGALGAENSIPLHIGMLHDNDSVSSAAARLSVCHANRIALLPRPFRLHILLNNTRVSVQNKCST